MSDLTAYVPKNLFGDRELLLTMLDRQRVAVGARVTLGGIGTSGYWDGCAPWDFGYEKLAAGKFFG